MLNKTNNIELIFDLDKQCFNNNHYSYELLKSMIDYNDFYVITYNCIDVGFLIIQKINDDYEIIKIGILKLFQKQGLAYQSLLELINNFNYNKIFLEVNNNNIAAINLYLKLGFKVIYTRKKYYKDNSDALIMELIKQ